MGAPEQLAINAVGTGKPVVLLHGVGADAQIWRPVVGRMRRARRLLFPDLPGFGASPAIGGGFDLREVADVLGEALAAAAGEPFDLVGNSLGGAVALVLARRHPQLVERLVLIAPAGFSPFPRALAEPVGRLAPAALAGRRILGTPLAGSGLARRVMLWGTVADAAELSADDVRLMLGASRRSSRIAAAVSAVLAADLLDQLEGLGRPPGLMWGERDRVVPLSTLAAIVAACPGARVEIIPRAGHVPQLERPAEFVRALKRLLKPS